MTKRKKSKFIHVPLPLPSYYHNSKFCLEIKKSNIENAGFGVFSNTFIPADSFIDFYQGKIITKNCNGSSYFFHIHDLKGIDAIEYPRCYMAMLNDAHNSSFENNCEFRVTENEKVEVWSIVDIYPDEELLVDYGDEYFL